MLEPILTFQMHQREGDNMEMENNEIITLQSFITH